MNFRRRSKGKEKLERPTKGSFEIGQFIFQLNLSHVVSRNFQFLFISSGSFNGNGEKIEIPCMMECLSMRIFHPSMRRKERREAKIRAEEKTFQSIFVSETIFSNQQKL